MEYTHNGLTKSETFGNTNNYILKINSRDRDITREQNPFNFKIKFNRTSGKYTTYFEKGYFGSGNIWKKNDNNPQKNWNEGSYYYNKTFNINNGAVIEDPIDEIKDIKITEIVAPRFIPESEIGYKLYNIEAMSNPLDSSGIFLRGIDNTSIKFIDDTYTVNNVDTRYQFCQIEDMYGKKYFLFNNVDVSNLPECLKKNYYLFNDYYTDTLLLNEKIYKVYDISNGYIKLTDGTSGSVPQIDFLKTDVRLAKFYYDNIWYQEGDSNITFEDSTITLDQSGESLITVDLVKDSYIEVSYRTNSGDNLDYSYFKITSVQHEINLQIDMNFINVNFNSSNKTITLDNLTVSNVTNIKDFVNINSIEVTNTTFNNSTLIISNIQQVGDCKIIITVSNSITNEDSDATISFKKIISKTYPLINLTEAENNELKTFLNDNGSPDVIKNKVTITGTWKYNTKPPSGEYEYFFKHIKLGVKDLLNEKLFYVSLDPIVPPRNLTTNGKLNNIIGTFYPSTQSKNYIFLSGQNRQQYTHRNLQNLKELNFKLYYMDGTPVGETLKNYSLDYLELDCKQTNITFLIDQVDRHMS